MSRRKRRPPARIDAEAFARAVRQAALDGIDRPDTCIHTTHIGVLAAAQLGLRIDPVPVQAAWANPFWSVGIEGTGDVTVRDGRRGWDGHLVGHISGLNLLVDFTADQFSRPHKALTITGPFLYRATRDELRHGVQVLNEATGITCRYRETRDTSWLTSDAWLLNPDRTERLARLALVRLEATR